MGLGLVGAMYVMEGAESKEALIGGRLVVFCEGGDATPLGGTVEGEAQLLVRKRESHWMTRFGEYEGESARVGGLGVRGGAVESHDRALT